MEAVVNNEYAIITNFDLTPIAPKRNRHTVKNDQDTALIKRINRCYARRGCTRKIRVINGEPRLIDTETGLVRENFMISSLTALAELSNIDNYRKE
jgi:hypothetical protein